MVQAELISPLVPLSNSAVYSSFSFVLGFLLVFRTLQAHTRFWEGATLAHQMRGQWMDACSSLFAFATVSKRAEDDVLQFMHMLARLFSLLHAMALQFIAVRETEEFELIDVS